MLGEFTIIRKAKEAGFERGSVVGRVVPPPQDVHILIPTMSLYVAEED